MKSSVSLDFLVSQVQENLDIINNRIEKNHESIYKRNKTALITYAKDDLPNASRLYNKLVQVGFKVWLDKESLLPRQD